MIVSINQPAYLPWLGYFDRIAASDLHIVLDTVQFEKNGFVNRNKIRTAADWCWLTVPVETSGRFGDLRIDNLRIAGGRWKHKHWASLEQAYRQAAPFSEHREFFQNIYLRDWTRLIDLTQDITKYLLSAFGISTPLISASTLPTTAQKSDLVLDLCRQVRASVYLSGPLGRNYLDEASFERAGIDIVYQDYAHPVYEQVQSGFVPYMAAVDLLFTQGAAAGDILKTSKIPSHR